MSEDFTAWDQISVARAIAIGNLKMIAEYLNERECEEGAVILTNDEILKFQRLLYEECLSNLEREHITFEEFIYGK
ncbi:MAG: hypothetical protein LBV69_05075 [Bacteroidales bacterium]|nr:hypothetical protein [Bacteroidales bacterium]